MRHQPLVWEGNKTALNGSQETCLFLKPFSTLAKRELAYF
jgi:hypothetical protein